MKSPPAFKDHFSGQAPAYERYRPRYPRELFAWLAAEAPARDVAVDIATGNGQAAAGQRPRIRYRQEPAERISLPDASADLIVAAQAAHWFDWGAFVSEACRVLRPGGLLAVWSYGRFVARPDIDRLVDDFSRDVVGPDWPRERRHVEEGYRDLPLPFPECAAPRFEMRAEWDCEAVLGYLGTWSAVQRCRERSGRDPTALLAPPRFVAPRNPGIRRLPYTSRPRRSWRSAMSRCTVLLALVLASMTASAAEVSTAPLASGIDMTAMDRNVRPQDDLFRHVNGTWLANTPFPAEYASAGIGIMLFEKAQEDVHAILLEAAAAGHAATPDMRRLGDMYTSFMDEKRVEERGVAPLAPLFAEIAAIDGPQALARFFGRALGLGIDVPMGSYVFPDARNSTHNVAYLSQTGLGMPNRDYFLRDEDAYVEFRRKYVDYLAKLLTLAGEPNGAERAAKILELETKIATDQWTPV